MVAKAVPEATLAVENPPRGGPATTTTEKLQEDHDPDVCALVHALVTCFLPTIDVLLRGISQQLQLALLWPWVQQTVPAQAAPDAPD